MKVIKSPFCCTHANMVRIWHRCQKFSAKPVYHPYTILSYFLQNVVDGKKKKKKWFNFKINIEMAAHLHFFIEQSLEFFRISRNSPFWKMRCWFHFCFNIDVNFVLKSEQFCVTLIWEWNCNYNRTFENTCL